MRQLAILILCIAATFCNAQEVVKIIDITPRTGLVNETLPFDKSIILKWTSKEPVIIESAILNKINKGDVQKYYYNTFTNLDFNKGGTYDEKGFVIVNTVLNTSINLTADNKYEVSIYIPPLQPNKFYDLTILRRPLDIEASMYLELFDAYHKGNWMKVSSKLLEINEIKKPFKNDINTIKYFYKNYLKSIFNEIDLTKDENAIVKFKSQIKEIIKTFKPTSEDDDELDDFFIFWQSISATTTSLSFDTRTNFAITPDFGYVYYGFQDKFKGIAPYIGFQIEFRYFDKNIPFRLIRNKSLWQYLSFTSGLTLVSLKKENRREDFFTNKSLLMGFGFRITNAIRITTGGILFNMEDPNPLIDNKTLGVTPFVGLSIDIKLKSILNDFYGLIPTNRQ